MKNSKLLFLDFISRLHINESKEEAGALAYLVLEKLFNITQTDIVSEKKVHISDMEMSSLLSIISRINRHEPIQYILGEADFFGRKFNVNPSVLIPRPETEELVANVIQQIKTKNPKILDVGTGSGCIAITLALEIPHATVFAIDVSAAALEIAKFNARQLGAKVTFFNQDILNTNIELEALDVVVSNPPYVTISESGTMEKKVLAHEPHLALFVPDNDALVFYEAIAKKSKLVLKSGGLLIVEINANFGSEVIKLFNEKGFTGITIIQDINGKQRFVLATLQ